jgi:DNA (cytosine-5)-methyltransferase 1
MALFALRALGVSFHHVFASDVDPNARAFLQENHPADIMYHDLRNRHLDDMPSVDLHIAGFPCQPFSSAGLLQGFGALGENGLLFFHILEYIKVQQPRAFLLETVAGLLTVNQGACFQEIWLSLSALVGYQSQWRLMNTWDHGVPQNRPQVFIVGMLQRMCFTPFQFPGPLPPTELELFLELRLWRPSLEDLPPTSQCVARQNVLGILHALRHAGHDPFDEPWVIDCDSSAARCHAVRGVSPCITRSRGGSGGHWVTKRGQRMTVDEAMRLQGWMGPFARVLPAQQMGRHLGNAMSANVVERLLCRLLPAMDLWPAGLLEDRWAAGTAVAAFRD